MSTSAMRAALGLLYYSGASAMFRPFLGGMGAIFMLHHVRPGEALHQGFHPNYGLEMTPEFLDQVIRMVVAKGFDLVTMDEVLDRIEGKSKSDRRFAAFTLDDGYRDNREYALPVFKRHNCPFTIYVAPAITDGTCELWWRGLEDIIAKNDRVKLELGGRHFDLPARTVTEKWRAWKTIYRPLRNMDQHAQRRWTREACAHYGIDLDGKCRAAAMTWDELREIAREPLCTLGAHTINHYALRRLSDTEAFEELVKSADRIEKELGKRPVHFAYPYGDAASAGPRDFELARKAGYRSAVTTRKGVIFPEHAAHLTALPRASLSGKIAELPFVSALTDGLAFALFNRFRRINVG